METAFDHMPRKLPGSTAGVVHWSHEHIWNTGSTGSAE